MSCLNAVNWAVIGGIASAIASILAAAAALWSAVLAARSNGQAARERRTVLEREANRALDTVPAVARRLVTLAEGLDREYTTVFAMAGRNLAGAALHRERAAERRKEAEFIVARLRVWMARPVEGSSDGELEALVRAPLCANVTWNTCLLEFTVQGSITHGSSTGFFDEPRSVDSEPGHPGRSP